MSRMVASQTPSGARGPSCAPPLDISASAFAASHDSLCALYNRDSSKSLGVSSATRANAFPGGICEPLAPLPPNRNTLGNRNPRNLQKTNTARRFYSQHIRGVKFAFAFSSCPAFLAPTANPNRYSAGATLANPSGTNAPRSCKIICLGRGI